MDKTRNPKIKPIRSSGLEQGYKLFELKAIKVNERLSEETFCYSANIYVGKTKVAEVSNHGHGGCDNQYPINKEKWQELVDAVNELPDEEKEIYGTTITLEPTIEQLCWDQVADYLQVQDFKKSIRNKVAFYTGEWNGSFNYYPLKSGIDKSKQRQAIAEILPQKYPGAVILNELGNDEILALLNNEETVAA
jgi:hypothetical protein